MNKGGEISDSKYKWQIISLVSNITIINLTIKIGFYTNIFLSGKLIKIIDRTEDYRTAKKQNNTSVATKK